MPGCKAREVMRNEAYFSYAAKTNVKRNEAAGRFSTACKEKTEADNKPGSVPRPKTGQ